MIKRLRLEERPLAELKKMHASFVQSKNEWGQSLTLLKHELKERAVVLDTRKEVVSELEVELDIHKEEVSKLEARLEKDKGEVRELETLLEKDYGCITQLNSNYKEVESAVEEIETILGKTTPTVTIDGLAKQQELLFNMYTTPVSQKSSVREQIEQKIADIRKIYRDQRAKEITRNPLVCVRRNEKWTPTANDQDEYGLVGYHGTTYGAQSFFVCFKDVVIKYNILNVGYHKNEHMDAMFTDPRDVSEIYVKLTELFT